MIPPPPPPLSGSSPSTNRLPPPPPSSLISIPKQPKKKIIEKKKPEEEIKQQIDEEIVQQHQQFVVDESMVVKDLCSLSGVNPLYSDLKILLVATFSRPNHSAKVLEESIQNSILESGRTPDIVLTPEGWHASPLMSTPDRNIVMNKELEGMCQVMKNHKCYGFIGVKVWAVDEKLKPINKYYNSMIVINPDGEVLGCYRKRVPTSAESSTPGDRIGIFDTIYGRIAVLICFDIENQVILDEVLAYKPFLILNPTYIGGVGLHDNTLSKKSTLMTENEEKSRRFQVKISLEALGRNFEKVCKDNNVTILRCDTPVHYGGRGTHQLMTPYSTVYPPSYYAENSFSFYVDRVGVVGNNFAENTEPPERERTHNEDNVGPRYTLFSNSHQDVVLRSENINPNFKVTFFNHNRLICSDERRITVVNTDIMACENFSLDHVSLSVDSDGNFKVNDSKIDEEIRIVDIWTRFDKKHLIVLMSDGNVGLFKVLDEERLKVANNSILCLEKQFKWDCSLVDPNSRIIAPNNNMLFIASSKSIVQLGNLSGGEFIGKTFLLENEVSKHVSISDSMIEYLSLNNKSISLVLLDLSTGNSSISSTLNLEEISSKRLESSLEPNSFILTEFDPSNQNVISLTPLKVQNHQISIQPNHVKLPENSSSIISLNSSKFICGQQDGTLKLLDSSCSSDLIRHKFHPYPSLKSTRVVSLIHDKQNGRLISIHQHKTQPDGYLLCMAKFGNNRFVANLTTLFQ
ncbi:predicted protein [Naegleria gruberi]|uniref:Predicted protein n=1 Tax=Naegleria gruberi TaxID=5762 RepID=D2VLH5_NAEGR|nr:uncharacterized protein NAEGRDRAFT_50540 [Naegleria gruberi]EFC42314.1 predicted protein [Naegleria gruberi]|eukprot:XP_002675058.1 predicted protein [Naegleria gruberi strain NEG-M]